MKTAFLIIAVFLLVSEALILQNPADADGGYKTYSGYSVIRVIPKFEHRIEHVNKMEEKLKFKPDFWKSPSFGNSPIDIMVSPDKREEVIAYLKKGKMNPIIKIADVGKYVAADKAGIDGYEPNPNLATDPDSFDFSKFHPFSEMMAYIEAVAAKYSSFVSIASLGKSLEGRDMKYLKIGYPSKSKKNALFIDAGMTAREWIGPATALYTINQFVTNSSYTDLLKAIDIYIAPSINPDGYEYSRSKDRMWRKSRSGPINGCYGTNINRNFVFQWMVSGSSSDPCSENFAGPNAFSEIEAVNLANFIVSHRDTIKAYLTLHSYGKSILYPWGYTFEQRIPDAIDLRALGDEMASAVHADYFMNEKGYTLSPASGASDDYSKSVGVKYVYHINLRPGSIALAEDNSTKEWHGFLLTPRCIKPSAEEIFPAFLVAANKVRNGPF